MNLFISASAIKDFLKCSKMYYYRRFYSKKNKPSEAMIIGSIFHETVEKEWKDKEKAIELATNSALEYNLTQEYLDKTKSFVDVFFNKFSSLLSEEDLIETKFKIPYRDFYLVGMMDRILSSGIVLDWKTGKHTPRSISYDPQFILYNWAYKQLYHTEPTSVLYCSLTSGKTVQYKSIQRNEDLLFNEILPFMVQEIRLRHFSRTGILEHNSPCFGCAFREVCLDELDSGKFIVG